MRSGGRPGTIAGANWGAIVSHWKLFLYLVFLMMAMNFAAHGTQDMYPAFPERHWHFGVSGRAAVTGCSLIGAIAGGTLVGWISDKIGRRRAMIGALLLATLAVPLWAFAPSVTLLVTGAFPMQFLVQGAWGVIPAHLTELSPDSVRGFLPGFGYQCGVLLASAVTYIEAVFADRINFAIAMAGTAVSAFLLAALATAVGPERRATVFGK